jgi:2-amino-4-hydroxy-6-hydroxymethyldihydropteridine diphosphokinase
MILLGLGANLPSLEYGPPQATLAAALKALAGHGVIVERLSPWYRSAPVPAGDQPWYVNGVVAVKTGLAPAKLLEVSHGIERRFGRIRREANEARVLDLDLLDYAGLVQQVPEAVLPHPRLHERAFVLLPLRDIAPNWRHPVLGRTAAEMIAALPPGQQVERLTFTQQLWQGGSGG